MDHRLWLIVIPALRIELFEGWGRLCREGNTILIQN
jgi:hypothetical protein